MIKKSAGTLELERPRGTAQQQNQKSALGAQINL